MNGVPAIPQATYRLQLGAGFTFNDATAIVPYLRDLGISHVYASPFLKARKGSTHGYDITDHNAFNSEIGSPDDFTRFSDTLTAHGMGLILDFVPNHMGIGHDDNDWWLDVLEWGQSSIYAAFFDINWSPLQQHLHGKVLLPVLGDQYGAILERGEIQLRFDASSGSLSAWYGDHRFPIRPRHYAIVIRRQLSLDKAAARLDAADAGKLEHLAAEFDKLRRPPRRLRAEIRVRAHGLMAELAARCTGSARMAEFMSDATAAFNGVAGQPRSFTALHGLLERQIYRLAFWRVAADEINYRRFFNISDLAGICMERPELFEQAHGLIGRLIADGRLHGLRLDHIDGLYDPRAYCRRLQVFALERRPDSAPAHAARQFYVVVEKILARHEALPDDWPVAGTTGYEFTNLVNGLFVDPAGERGLARIYAGFAGPRPDFDEILADAKGFVIDNILASEINVLAHDLDRISERHWSTRDYTGERLRAALKEIARYFPVYRTYVADEGATLTDRRDIDWAVSLAKRGWRGPDPEILDFVQAALTTDLSDRGGPFRRADIARFAMKFQQYTGPVMAKSLEDTSFYRYHLLLSLNEVGGDPRQFGVSVSAFHHANRQRAQRWPHSMLATATHDTKRGEDARLRLSVLSEMPAAWNRRVRRWSRLNRTFRRDVVGAAAPSRNDEYALYQTLIGAWPADMIGDNVPPTDKLQALADRLVAYTTKAVREAKVMSSWDNPNLEYEDACAAFVRRLTDSSRANPFLADFMPFQAEIAFFGMLGALSQVALKLTVPGMPDIYQGTEGWDLSLVDPDNRRPVDFAKLNGVLKEMDATTNELPVAMRRWLGAWQDGRIKLALMHRLLRLRRDLPALFADGGYEALSTQGEKADHVAAFLRRQGDHKMIVIVGRKFASLLRPAAQSYDDVNWHNTAIDLPADAAGGYIDALTRTRVLVEGSGEAISIQAQTVLSALPIAVLVSSPAYR